jgi:hypothetical protein
MIVQVENRDDTKFHGSAAKIEVNLKFDKGDKVKVINAGACYTSHTRAMNYFGISSDDLYDRDGIEWTEDDGQVYDVINVCLNANPMCEPIYLIHCDKGYLIIGEEGIKFFNQAYQRRGEYRDETGISNLKSIYVLHR